MHWADRAAGRAFARTSMFGEGFGDLEALQRMYDDPSPFAAAVTPRPQIGSPTRGRDGCYARTLRWHSSEIDARFESSVQTAIACWLSADPHGRRKSERPTVVSMSASGEEGFQRRRKVFAPLVREGLDVMLLENPFYGSRRRPGQPSTRLPTVYEQFHMNHASVREAIGLIRMLRDWGRSRLGLVGYSMGGYMVCLVASALAAEMPLALVPVAAGRSPRSVYLDGALSWSVDFQGLRDKSQADRAHRVDDARGMLGELFESTTRLLHDPHPRSRVILAAAERDGFVFPDETHALLRMWPEASLRSYRGGHAHVFLTFDAHVRRAVRDAFRGLR